MKELKRYGLSFQLFICNYGFGESSGSEYTVNH